MSDEADEVVFYLNPCPFCGCKAVGFKNDGFMGFTLFCNNKACNARVISNNKENTIQKWQKRIAH